MAEARAEGRRPSNVFGRLLVGIARALGLFGGFLTFSMAIIVTVSVAGRYFFSAPIQGDYDIVGIIAGCAAFSFLPICQLKRSNVLVDVFTSRAPVRAKAALDAFANLCFLLIAVFATWRLIYGGIDMYRHSEVIAAFNFYRWYTFPFDIACMLVLIVAIAYTLAQDASDIWTGRPRESTAVGGGE